MRALFTATAAPTWSQLGVLIPLVDLLTLLLVAVLRTSSAEPALTPVEVGFSLPVTTAETAPSLGLAIDVGLEGLYVDGWRAGGSGHWSRAGGPLIPELLDAVQAAAPERVLVRAHAEAEWRLVGKVLFTVQQAGVEAVELVAVSRMSL
jgi:biopolymer transport protein ExbD